MRDKRKYKIFLGAQEIAGMMDRLQRAFNELGAKCDFYCMDDYKFSAVDEENIFPMIKRYRAHTDKLAASKTKRGSIKLFWRLVQMVDILYIYIYSLLHYNEYLYIFGHGLFIYNRYLARIQELEFFLLKLFRKKVVVWFCGSDSRAPYCDCDIYGDDTQKMWEDVKRKKEKISMLEKYAILIDGPASSHFHNKPFIAGVPSIGIPIDDKEKAHGKKEKNQKVTILHAPSVKKYKGSAYIRQIIEEIISEKYDIEYMEVSGVPHTVVLEKMAQADIVIDQVFSDTPMAGFAVEASYNGIPVVVAGEFSKVYREELPEPIPPTIYCTLDEVKDKLIWLITNPQERIRIGKEEQEFVEKNYLSNIVAEKFCRLFDNKIPKEWWFSPERNVYPFGFGLRNDEVVSNVVKLIDKYGEDALGIPKEGKLFAVYRELYEQYKKKEEAQD